MIRFGSADGIFFSQLDQSITHMGLRVLKAAYRSP